MQVNKVQHNVQSYGIGKSQSFALSANDPGKIFDILIRYTYPIRAVVREYTCNALDIHNQIGQTRPFLVVMPNANEPMWRCRDYGTGLADDQIGPVLCTYLASLKDGDNNQIGGFGLGSKAGFGYTDMFVVTSWQNGWKSVYNIYRGPDRVPAFALLERCEDPSEPDGLEICVPVKNGDFLNFVMETQNILKHFPEGSYEVIGANIERPTFSVAGDGWTVERPERDWVSSYGSAHHGAAPKIKMGPVVYTVDWTQVGDSIPLSSMIIDMPIGSCSLPFTREQISVDEPTKAALLKRIEEVRADGLKTALKLIDQAESLWQAATRVYNYSPRFAIFGSKLESVTYRGVEIRLTDGFGRGGTANGKRGGGIVVAAPEGTTIKSIAVERLSVKTPKWDESTSTTIVPARDYVVFDNVSDSVRNVYLWSRLQCNQRMFRKDTPAGRIYIVPYSTDNFRRFGEPSSESFFNLSQLGLPPSAANATRKAVDADPVVYRRSRHEANTWVQSRYRMEYQSAKLYVPFKGAEPEDGNWYTLANLPWCAGMKYIGLPKRARDEADFEADGLVELRQFVSNKAAELMAEPDFMDRWTARINYRELTSRPHSSEIRKIADAVADKRLAEYCEQYDAVTSASILAGEDFSSLLQINAILKLDLPTTPEHRALKLYEQITTHYPVLNFMLNTPRFDVSDPAVLETARKAATIKR